MAQMYNITYNVPARKCLCYLSKFDFVEYHKYVLRKPSTGRKQTGFMLLYAILDTDSMCLFFNIFLR